MPVVNLVLREAQPQDRSAIIEVLATTFSDTDVGRWLDPDPQTRLPHARAHFPSAVDHALTHGTVRVADEGGTIVAASLWSPHPSASPADPDPVADGAVLERLRLLGDLLAERHPAAPAHHHLTYLGVRPDRQGEGIGSYLLIGHHAYLHVSGIPAYLEASDPRSRQLYLRHGYVDISGPIVLPTGLPIWPMWRPPAPAGAITATTIASSSDAPLARLARR